MPKGFTRVLIVDDDTANQKRLSQILVREGYETIAASTGKEALQKVKDQIPDLVLLAVNLPDILGYQVCRHIKKDTLNSGISVALMADSFEKLSEQITDSESDPDIYLQMPVDEHMLVATIKSLLRFRKLNDHLKEREEKLRLATENARLGTWDHWLIEKKLHWSDRTKEIFGIDVGTKDLDFIDLLDHIHPEDQERVRTAVQVALSPQSTGRYQMEYRVVLPNGKVRWVDSRGAAVFNIINGEKKAVRFTGTVIDITLQKNAHEEIMMARDQAESANKAKNQFIANVSHEIRTPLGVIAGFSDLMSEQESLDETAKGYLQIIRRNVHVLGKLIDEVLDLSKIEANRMDVESITFELAPILNEVKDLLHLAAGEKSITLKVNSIGLIPKNITSDPTRLRQILMNLVGNAIKFTSQGLVEVQIKLISEHKIGSPTVLKIDVIDSGIGISKEQSEKLFAPFAQADTSMTRKYGGTGLGLLIAKRLAEALGGSLTLSQSELGKGSTFSLQIPGGPLEELVDFVIKAPGKIETKRGPGNILAQKNILLVEDSSDNQLFISHLLESEGAIVDTASNGAQGVEKALMGQHDLLLMDLQMPVMDGYEATQTLRKKGFKKPIMAITAHALKDEKERCLAAGFDDYLTKPVDRQLLFEKAKRFF